MEEALYDCINIERLARQQVFAMRHAMPFRELSEPKIKTLQERYGLLKEKIVKGSYRRIAENRETQPIPGAWNGHGRIPANDDFPKLVPKSRSTGFFYHSCDATEWGLRLDMAATCRLLSRLNGHENFEGTFAHFSMQLEDGNSLIAPTDVPYAAMKASSLVLVDKAGNVVDANGSEGSVDKEAHLAFARLMRAGGSDAKCILFTHATFADQLAQQGTKIRPVSQSSFNYCADTVGHFDAFGHELIADSTDENFSDDLIEYMIEGSKCLVILAHGGMIVRGEDPSHCFSIAQGCDAAAEVQVKAEMSGFPLLELPIELITKRRVERVPQGGGAAGGEILLLIKVGD